MYHVTPTTCECYDFKHSGRCCKHLDAMRILTTVLAAKLDAAMPLPPEDLYARLIANGETDAVAAECADEAMIDPILGDDSLFVIPGSQSNQRHLFDRLTDLDICTVQRNPRGDWRPATAQDTIAWARWLGWRQGEEEGAADPTPRTLAAVLAGLGDAPGVTCTISNDFGDHSYTLTAYRYDLPGSLRVSVPDGDRVRLSSAAFGQVIEGAGCQVAGRTKQGGYEYSYRLERQPVLVMA